MIFAFCLCDVADEVAIQSSNTDIGMLLQLFLCFSIALSALVHQDHAAESHLTQYGHHYKTLVLDLRNRTINILHIGECSADLCARYKPDSVIYCTDILSPAEWELSNTHVSFCNGPPHTFPNEFDKQLDMIVDTRKFALSPFESTLVSLFGTLKAGGFYFVEGVDYGNEGHVIQDSPDLLRADTNHVFHNNHVYMVDTSVPRRMNSETYGEAYTAKGRMHDDYLLVVRKRIGAVPEVKVNSGMRMGIIDVYSVCLVSHMYFIRTFSVVVHCCAFRCVYGVEFNLHHHDYFLHYVQ